MADAFEVVKTMVPGDTFLLFDHLPYDFEEELPISVGPNVYLNDTPQDVLDRADPSLSGFVLPGYHLTGRGLTNCCLGSPGTGERPPGLTPNDLFFLAITALRLRAPIGISVAGGFELGPSDELIRKPTLFSLMSAWQPDSSARYVSLDVRLAEQITMRMIHIAQNNCKRITSSLVLFSQVTCGLSKSFQMSYLALFASLEALFAPKGNKAVTLARRIAQFLAAFDFPESLKDWLEREYKMGRNNLAHGLQDVTPWMEDRVATSQVLGRLHEVTRLCLLGFMSLDDKKVALLSRSEGQRLQRELDNLIAASGRFIDGQRMWCS